MFFRGYKKQMFVVCLVIKYFMQCIKIKLKNDACLG